MHTLPLIIAMFLSPPADVGPPPPPPPPPRPNVAGDELRQGSTGHMVAHRIGAPLPEPICPADLQRFSEFLMLAAPQQALLAQAHGRYMERIGTIVDEGMPLLDALNVRATAASEQQPSSYLAARASKDLYDQQGRMRREMEQADEVLFAELESVLAESQMPGMTRVRNFRHRASCTTRATWMVRPARVDLAALARSVVNDADALARVDSTLHAYESEATPLMAALEREMTDIRVPMLELTASRVRDENDQPAPTASLRQRTVLASEKRMQLLAESVRLQRRIADLNAATLAALLAALPSDRSETLQAEYRRQAFGVVYQDQFAAHRACTAVLESTSISEAQRTAVQSLCASYSSAYEAINADMQRVYTARCIEYAGTLGNRNHEPYRLKMRQLREDRWRLTLGLVRQLQTLLPAIDAGSDLEYLRQAIEHAIRQSANDRYPGS